MSRDQKLAPDPALVKIQALASSACLLGGNKAVPLRVVCSPMGGIQIRGPLVVLVDNGIARGRVGWGMEELVCAVSSRDYDRGVGGRLVDGEVRARTDLE